MKIIKERQEVQINCLNCNSLLELSSDDIEHSTSGYQIRNYPYNQPGPYFPQKDHYSYKCAVCELLIPLGDSQIPLEFKNKAKNKKSKNG
jgi:hypothetical protein